MTATELISSRAPSRSLQLTEGSSEEPSRLELKEINILKNTSVSLSRYVETPPLSVVAETRSQISPDPLDRIILRR